ncbi:hypothetical protein EWM64_g7565 [Hericium alpestre]|uniref:Histidine-specific methyltransferase SAM-dependent domain-containing protein n=1 Tax=Hericium alpestre TaxID=135208 RepID=A0A4Y9ZNJ8_9AGAM|nr:hypothetical protein EWM64_g7565 [Hericium alpestre]
MAAHIDIVNLHADKAGADTRSTILEGLQRPEGSKELPTLLLYDERGLRLYDDITTSVDEYYLFPAEERILKTNAADIVRVMHGASNGVVTGETVLELGAGALRKTSQVLSALASLVPTTSAPAPVTYYALDLEERGPERERHERDREWDHERQRGRDYDGGRGYSRGRGYDYQGRSSSRGSYQHGGHYRERDRYEEKSRPYDREKDLDRRSSRGSREDWYEKGKARDERSRDSGRYGQGQTPEVERERDGAWGGRRRESGGGSGTIDEFGRST